MLHEIYCHIGCSEVTQIRMTATRDHMLWNKNQLIMKYLTVNATTMPYVGRF